MKETLRQAFISVDKEYFESIGKFHLDPLGIRTIPIVEAHCTGFKVNNL